MVKKILVAIDGSDPSLLAFDEAASLARVLRVPVVVMAAVAPMPIPTYGATPGLAIPSEALATALDSLSGWYDSLVKEKVAELRSQGIQAEGRVVLGSPVDTILDAQVGSGADLIVVGSRGLSMTKRLLMGSVSTGVVTHAACAVLVVRGPVSPDA